MTLLAVAYLTPFVLWLGYGLKPWVLLPFVSIPLAAHLIRTVTQETAGPPLNRALAGAAQLSAIFAALLAVGIVI